MAIYEIWRINPATKELIERTTRRRIDAARQEAHRMIYETCRSFGLLDRQPGWIALDALQHFDGGQEFRALIGDHEIHLYRG